ncbi:MAG: nuclear transport factor 2 family protein [Kibdelosporangium sp.]
MRNGDVVRRVYELFSAGRLDQIRELVSADFDWTFFGPDELPWAGKYTGHGGFDEFFAVVADHVQVEQFEVNEYIEAGDQVVAVGTSTARILGTETRYHATWINVFTLTDGRISRLLDLYDTGTVVRALRSARS